MATSATTSTQNYKKRSGTSGIQGHLYETKLLSLIYFRALYDDNIQDFNLATNVDKLGSFDDICFRAKVEGIVEPLVVFIQAKHRENNSLLTLNSKSDLLRYYNSYLEIRSKFKPKNEDVLFDGKFSETKCIFVIYTTARVDWAAQKNEDSYTTFLNELIGTDDLGSGLQPLDDSGNAKLIQILLEDEMTMLARLMAKCILGEFHDINMLMQEEVVLRYHVILAQQVFDVSEVQSEGYRDARFRNDFFDNSEELVQLFREKLCEKVLKSQKFVSHVNEKQDIIQTTGNMAVISALQFKVPASFGNKDLTIRGDDEKKNRKLIYLTTKIRKLIEKYKPSTIVKIHEDEFRETLEEGFLQLNGGIASAVGNLLVFDEHSKLLKFNYNYESLGELAKKLFDQLDSKIDNLFHIKFDLQVKIFPKLSFAADEYTKTTVSNFFKLLLFYTSQAKEAKVEKILIEEIEKKLPLNDVHSRNIKSSTIYLKYHDIIQKWWMNEIGEYLRGDGSLYQNAKKHALSQPLMSFIDMMQRISKNNYTFIEDAVNLIKLDDLPSGTLIVTNNISLTVAKLINHQVEKSCVVLDMQYILNLSESNVQILQTELNDLSKENMLILVCDKAIFNTSFDKTKLTSMTSSLRDKTAYIILNDQDYVESAKKYFTVNENVIKDERNSLTDMTEKSQKTLLENTNVVFQGVEVSLDQVLDDESHALVGEFALNKLMQSDTKNIIGKPASPLHYKGKIYIERYVKCFQVVCSLRQTRDPNYKTVQRVKRISTLFDLEDDVILVFGESGIGKTTLLTKLSSKTKQLDPSVWILRINLLDYSKQFFEWQNKEIVIDTLKSLKFLCHVALSGEIIKNSDVQITLEELNGTVSLKNCDGDQWTVFELKMFLHYYNTKQLRIIFDGFDEICPTYTHEVLSLIKAVINLRQKHKIWISSRTCDRIIKKLDLQFIYKIEPLDSYDQSLYLYDFWKEKNLRNKLDPKQVDDFCKFMSKSEDLRMHRKKSHLLDESINEKLMLPVYLSLFKYFKKEHTSIFPNFHKKPEPKFSGFVAIPLHLKMVADHLYNVITEIYKYGSSNASSILSRSSLRSYDSFTFRKFDLDTNIFEIYESFLENKLKIRFQEKNQIDMYRPDNIEQFKREYADTKDNLKKLAAYVVYDKRLLNEFELKRCEKIIVKLKEGEEKTDIICNVVNDVPIFVHLTFAEHLAVEYICDLIKRSRNLKYIYNFILNVMFHDLNKNILVILEAKIKLDEELITIMEKHTKVISRLLLEQGKFTKNKHGCIKSSLCVAIRLGLRNLASFLFSTYEKYMNESDLLDFIEIVKRTNMLMTAVKMEFDDLIIRIIDKVRSINESKLRSLFENIEIFNKNDNFARESTTELVQKLHANVWTRMDIVPDWENLAELSSQIYFI